MIKAIHSTQQKQLQRLLRRIRQEAELTQRELAERIEVPQSVVSKYETGERRLDLVELKQVCEAVGVPLQEFVRRFEEGV